MPVCESTDISSTDDDVPGLTVTVPNSSPTFLSPLKSLPFYDKDRQNALHASDPSIRK